jgi:hypothetical protein
MPYEPSSIAPNFSGRLPASAPPKVTDRRKAEKPIRKEIFGEPLSIKTYEPDPASVIRALFGKEVETDARTGGLVPAERK